MRREEREVNLDDWEVDASSESEGSGAELGGMACMVINGVLIRLMGLVLEFGAGSEIGYDEG